MATLCKTHFLQQLYRKIDGKFRLQHTKNFTLANKIYFNQYPHHTPSFLPPVSPGAVLWSQNERNLDCVVTFQTHSILQRFMLRFDMLQLDCNDHLYIYDGSHAVGTHKVSSALPGVSFFPQFQIQCQQQLQHLLFIVLVPCMAEAEDTHWIPISLTTPALLLSLNDCVLTWPPYCSFNASSFISASVSSLYQHPPSSDTYRIPNKRTRASVCN